MEELYRLSRFLELYKPVGGKADTTFFKTLEIFVGQKNELSNLVGYFDHIDLKSQGISLYQDILRLQVSYLALEGMEVLGKKNAALVLQDKTLMEIIKSVAAIRTTIVEA